MIELEDPDKCLRLYHCKKCLIYDRSLEILAEARPAMDPVAGKLVLYCNTYKLEDYRLRTLVEFFDPVLRKDEGIFCLCRLLIRRNPGFPTGNEPWVAECDVLRIQENLTFRGGKIQDRRRWTER